MAWTKTAYLSILSQLHLFCLKHTHSWAGQLAVTSGKGERQLERSSSSTGIARSEKGLLSLAFFHSRHTLHMTNLVFKRNPQNAYPKNFAAAAFLLRGRMSYSLGLGGEKSDGQSRIVKNVREMFGDEDCNIHWALTCIPEPAWVLSSGIMRKRCHLKKLENKKERRDTE